MVLARNLSESTKTQHHARDIYSTDSLKVQHNQLLEFNGLEVVRIKGLFSLGPLLARA